MKALAVGVAVGFVMILLSTTMLVLIVVSASLPKDQQDSRCGGVTTDSVLPVAATSGGGLGLNQAQLSIVGQIVGTGRRLRIPPQGIVVALAVARQESTFRNLANDGLGGDLNSDQRGVEASLRLPNDGVGTDHGSVGAFQQQVPWWGTVEELMTPSVAAEKFYAALLKVHGWQDMPVTEAAQKVQRSAYPSAYADDEQAARALLAATSPGGGFESIVTTAAGLTVECISGGDGAVVYPVKGATGADRKNWGGKGARWSSWHTGTDFSVACGTPVVAAAAGVVELDTSESWAGRWLVKVTAGPGKLTTWYAHMQRVSVTSGQHVEAGQILGEVGAEGNATGCHLHFEVHTAGGSIYGPDNVNPTGWLADNVGPGTISVGALANNGPGGFRVATFNVLGHHHTAGGGRADGITRMGWTATILAGAGVDLVGFQEFEPPQERAFLSMTRGRWDLYPRSARGGSSGNAVAWRSDRWQLVDAKRVPLPYFGGRLVRSPAVLLRHLGSGRRVWVLSVHNPADAHGPAQHFRDAATVAEARLVNRLHDTGLPVILLGDMNDWEEFFCRVTALAPLHSATGGGTGRPCRPPPGRLGIDWVMGTTDIVFSNPATLKNALVQKTSDHPIVVADATLPGTP